MIYETVFFKHIPDANLCRCYDCKYNKAFSGIGWKCTHSGVFRPINTNYNHCQYWSAARVASNYFRWLMYWFDIRAVRMK